MKNENKQPEKYQGLFINGWQSITNEQYNMFGKNNSLAFNDVRIQLPASSPESKEVESDKSIYDYWMEKYPNGSNIHSQFKIFKTGFRGGKKSTESKILHFINSLEGLNGQTVQWYEGYFAFKKDLFNLLGATEKTEAPITSPIEVIKKRLEELEVMRSQTDDFEFASNIDYAIKQFNHILKLIQS